MDINIPHDSDSEAARLAAVRRYDILDSPPDGAFDRITAIVARRLNVPIAIISIVDNERIWFKSHHGLGINQVGREPGLCGSAILSTDPYIVTDAALDQRAKTNSLVTGPFGLRFYVGVPLRTSDDFNLGTLCVIDGKPRQVTNAEVEDLQDLASVVLDQMELRLSARRAIAHAKLMAREIDHRVMNSLQFISSMLEIQSRAPEAGLAKPQLQMAANRVAAVAQVHRHFYAEAAENTSCIDFLRRLGGDLAQILNRRIEISGDQGDVSTTLIQPIGLIVNELVTNAAKHGAGTINVSYAARETSREITVCDEGRGVPSGFDPEAAGGLGMKVLSSLVRQLGGTFNITPARNGSGACFMVSFPV